MKKPLPASARLPVSPRAVSDECFCLALRRAARAVSRRYDEALRPLGLNIGQFSMLTSIAGMEPMAVQTLADHLAMDRTTVTAALKPLERRDLVTLAFAADDQRTREISLTRAGRALLARAMPIWQGEQRRTRAEMTATGPESMRRQLAAMY